MHVALSIIGFVSNLSCVYYVGVAVLGYVSIVSERMGRLMRERHLIPNILLIVLIVLALVDILARVLPSYGAWTTVAAVFTPPATQSSPIPMPSVSPTNIFAAEGAQPAPLYALEDQLGWPKHEGRMKFKEIWGGHYIGGSAPLDGYIYYNTIFDDVTFVYDGKLPSGGWVNSQVNKGHFESTSPAIKTAFIIAESLNINPATQCGIGPASPPSIILPP